MTEGVATGSNTASYDEIHADWASETFYLLKRIQGSFLVFLEIKLHALNLPV